MSCMYCISLHALFTPTLTTSTSVELQVTESSTSLTCPSVSTVTSLMGTATRRPVRMAVFTTSVSYREKERQNKVHHSKRTFLNSVQGIYSPESWWEITTASFFKGLKLPLVSIHKRCKKDLDIIFSIRQFITILSSISK